MILVDGLSGLLQGGRRDWRWSSSKYDRAGPYFFRSLTSSPTPCRTLAENCWVGSWGWGLSASKDGRWWLLSLEGRRLVWVEWWHRWKGLPRNQIQYLSYIYANEIKQMRKKRNDLNSAALWNSTKNIIQKNKLGFILCQNATRENIYRFFILLQSGYKKLCSANMTSCSWFENLRRYQVKKTRITQSVRVTSRQSPIRMSQEWHLNKKR